MRVLHYSLKLVYYIESTWYNPNIQIPFTWKYRQIWELFETWTVLSQSHMVYMTVIIPRLLQSIERLIPHEWLSRRPKAEAEEEAEQKHSPGKKLKEPKVNPKRTQPNRKQLRRSQKKLKELKELKEIQAKRKHFTLLCVQWKRRHFDVLAKGRGEGGVERGVLCLGFRLVWLKNGCEFAVGIRSTIWATARRMNKSEKFHKFS